MQTELDPYQEIANYFDSVVGERHEIDLIKSLVQRHQPRAKSILEIACGTGAILEHFSANFEVEGLDISASMLDKARKRLGPANFYNQDMRDFNTGKNYDVILCIFNSINHLHKFSDWIKVFKSANKHLNPGGILIFDIVTEHGLKAFLTEPPVIEHKDDRVILLNYSAAPNGMLDMNIKVFLNKGEKNYAMRHGVVREKSFSRKKITDALLKIFQDVEVIDPERKRGVHRFSEILFFVAKKGS